MYALISLNDANYQPLADITWKNNKLKYAERHGYAAVCKTDNFRENITIGYQKIHFVKEILENHPEYDWVWWTGTDSLITNFAVRMEDRINNNYHFMICTDINGINADSFLIRNSAEGKQFVNDILGIEEESAKHWDSEQLAIATLLGLPPTGLQSWAHLPRTDPNLQISEKYQNVVKILPQRFMNSYRYETYREYTDIRDRLGVNGDWMPGDWLIHWPGTSLDLRLQLARHYITEVVQ